MNFTKYKLLLTFTFYCLYLQSQTINLPPINSYELDIDLAAKKIQTNDGAVVLLDFTDLHIDDIPFKKYYKIDKRVRIKILNKKGYKAADVEIPYITDENLETLQDIKAATINYKNGKTIVTEIPKKDIYTLKDNKFYNTKKFTFPNVNDSSILEYSYTVKQKSSIAIPNIKLQNTLPTIASYVLVENDNTATTFTSKGLNTYKLSYAKFDGENILLFDSMRSNCNRRAFSIYDVNTIEEEPYMQGQLNDYTSNLEIKIVTFKVAGSTALVQRPSLKSVNIFLNDFKYFGRILYHEYINKELDKLVDEATTTIDKINCVYNYVKKNYTYNGDKKIFCEGISEVVNAKGGSRGDLNLLFLNILRKYKINAAPFVGKEYTSGEIDEYSPNPFEFNVVGAYIPVGDTILLVDVSLKNYNLYLTPKLIMTTQILKIGESFTPWFYVWDGFANNKQFEYTELNLLNSELVTGTAKLTSSGYESVERLTKWQKDSTAFKKYYLETNDKNFKQLDIITDTTQDEFVQQLNFAFKPTQNGKFLILNCNNVFNNYTKNPFINATRITGINFGSCSILNATVKVNIPSNYKLTSTVKNSTLLSSDSSFTYEKRVKIKENYIIINNEVTFTKALFTTNEYQLVKEFYTKLIALFNEPLVFEKKE